MYKTEYEAKCHANPMFGSRRVQESSGPYYQEVQGKRIQYSIKYEVRGQVVPVYATLPKPRTLSDRFVEAY